MRLLSTPSHYAYLKISEGCDKFCSFCAIPYIRGRHVSEPMENIIAQAEALARKGVKELIVVAQDTTNYGVDLYGECRLTSLLEQLAKIKGIEWIRLQYSYPNNFPMDLLDLMQREPKICKYID
ncbi:MAG: radical SAM protein, partial [Bacteroidales bacterium]|nr:radical SAM protein [Bacteroidales bacterium]